MTIVVANAMLTEALVIAEVHLASALFAYQDIFPDTAPKPTLEELRVRWRRSLAAPVRAECNLVARLDGTVVGVGRASADPSDLGVGHLSRLYVAPEAWGSGVGKQLYIAAVNHEIERDPAPTSELLDRFTLLRHAGEKNFAVTSLVVFYGTVRRVPA